jgi:hypothetical protein
MKKKHQIDISCGNLSMNATPKIFEQVSFGSLEVTYILKIFDLT